MLLDYQIIMVDDVLGVDELNIVVDVSLIPPVSAPPQELLNLLTYGHGVIRGQEVLGIDPLLVALS